MPPPPRTIEEGPPPSAFGVPWATSWRPGQWRIVEGLADSTQRFHLLIAPTGFGKSITYVALAMLTSQRTVILTATKSLQDQLMRDFENSGMVDVRGMGNYECRASEVPELSPFMPRSSSRIITVDGGPCRSGHRCPLKDKGCFYFDRIREAARAELVVTNYDFWMHNRDKLGRVDLLVMDEAHQAPSELADFMSFRLSSDARRYFDGKLPKGEDVKVWADWARRESERIKDQIERGVHSKSLSDLGRDLERMARFLRMGEWVVEIIEEGPKRGDIHFDCINPEEFGESFVWGGVSKVLMVSATVNLMTAQALGICDAKGVVKAKKQPAA